MGKFLSERNKIGNLEEEDDEEDEDFLEDFFKEDV